VNGRSLISFFLLSAPYSCRLQFQKSETRPGQKGKNEKKSEFGRDLVACGSSELKPLCRRVPVAAVLIAPKGSNRVFRKN